MKNKVKNLNVSSKKTKEKIKQAFLEELYEKKGIQYVTVTDIVKKADITRSSFYTHYDSINDVARELHDNTMDVLLKEYKIETIDDIYTYIDNLTKFLKENENTYKMLLSANEDIFLFSKMEKTFTKKACEALSEILPSNNLELDLSFFIDGVVAQLLKYFRNDKNHSIDEINESTKIWFKKLFK